jgi:hypothetical protein
LFQEGLTFGSLYSTVHVRIPFRVIASNNFKFSYRARHTCLSSSGDEEEDAQELEFASILTSNQIQGNSILLTEFTSLSLNTLTTQHITNQHHNPTTVDGGLPNSR